MHFFANAFFPHYAGLVMAALYFVGMLVGVLVAVIFKKYLFPGEAVPFVMELPNYRLPSAKNVLQLLWEKAKDFIQKLLLSSLSQQLLYGSYKVLICILILCRILVKVF